MVVVYIFLNVLHLWGQTDGTDCNLAFNHSHIHTGGSDP